MSISPFAPEPIVGPVMLQRWESLTFLHWPYDAATIQARIPAELTLDTYDGRAWLGLTPFLLTRLRLPLGPALPWISSFPETNVRTYVRGHDGRRAIWFFTLECDRLLAVLAARASYFLPYRWSRMKVVREGGTVRYESNRRAASSCIEVTVGGAAGLCEFDHFLTARYRLYTRVAGRLAFANIDHAPWPLHNVTVNSLQQNIVEACGFSSPMGMPVAHHSPRIDVRIGRPRFA